MSHGILWEGVYFYVSFFLERTLMWFSMYLRSVQDLRLLKSIPKIYSKSLIVKVYVNSRVSSSSYRTAEMKRVGDSGSPCPSKSLSSKAPKTSKVFEVRGCFPLLKGEGASLVPSEVRKVEPP
ncbi:unnamed protein product [Spirodela intermedia]|uniref:Uncharacterized protein n=1 Tax=Spirodela intermedia TaxID=51605 RepID=A0A7I8L570_SPIIN|nr:unnamed protein product [Spirodela intermedia]